MNLALFDFDGTITTINTGAGFGFFIIDKKRKAFGCIALSPYLIPYKLGLMDIKAMRGKFTKFVYSNITEEKIRKKGREYATTVIPYNVRKKAMERIEWHKERGDKVVIVSASYVYYLEPWCEANGLELICNEISIENGVLTGECTRADCCAEQKPQRVLERYNLDDFDKVYAYGDTHEDSELLRLADKGYYRYFE